VIRATCQGKILPLDDDRSRGDEAASLAYSFALVDVRSHFYGKSVHIFDT
jgi:hypothetical protein